MRSLHLWTCTLLAVGLMVATAGPARAEDPAPAANAAVDKIVFDTLREVINKGADLYNPPSSDHAGCWRFYEGALISVKPFLSHRPAQQAAITKGLSDAYNESSIAARAFVLRKVIDDIRTALKPAGAPVARPRAALPPRVAPRRRAGLRPARRRPSGTDSAARRTSSAWSTTSSRARDPIRR
jgi:hypothetical protein